VTLYPPFGCSESQASSAIFLSQAEMPFPPAFFRYDAFSAAVQRKWTCLVARSFVGSFGRPLLTVVMAGLYAYTNNACNFLLGHDLMSTHLRRANELRQ
jgi:hypothetical protein